MLLLLLQCRKLPATLPCAGSAALIGGLVAACVVIVLLAVVAAVFYWKHRNLRRVSESIQNNLKIVQFGEDQGSTTCSWMVIATSAECFHLLTLQCKRVQTVRRAVIQVCVFCMFVSAN